MKNILFITLIAVWSSVAVAEIRFNPLNVARVEGVVGVTHDELQDAISAENQAFSNAVLAVGLNIDTNSVSVLNELAATFGGFPIEGTATTVGGLLVALAAAIAWLKKNKLDKTGGVVDGDIEITGEQGLVVKSSPFYIGFRQDDGSIVFLQQILDDQLNGKLDAGGTAANSAKLGGVEASNYALKSGIPAVVAPSKFATEGQAADAKAVNDALLTIEDAVKNKADRASLAPEYSPTSAYSVGAIVYHDGNIYQCKTAIAGGGEAWNAAHWEMRKLSDFFTESNSALTGLIASKTSGKADKSDVPYSLVTGGEIQDRAVNKIVADGTALTLRPPSVIAGKIRDFVLRIDCTATTTIDWSAFGNCETTGGKSWSDMMLVELGKIYIYRFTDMGGDHLCAAREEISL